MSNRPALVTETDGHFGTFLYVIGPKRGPVKIGISASPQVRLNTLQTGHPYELTVLAEVAVKDNGRESEESIHQFFLAYRVRQNGEWFHRTIEVQRLIEMAFCRLSPDLIMEKLRAERAAMWEAERRSYVVENRASAQRRRREA